MLKDLDSDQVIGIASLCWHKTLMHPGGIGRVEDVVVHKDYRRCGYGELLMKCAISTARVLKLEKLELTSKPERVEANRLYTELGFENKTTNCYQFDLS